MTVLHRTVADIDLSLCLPHRWATLRDPGPGVVVAARSPVVPRGGFVPELVLRAVTLDDLAPPVAGLDVEDAEDLELSGRPVRYERLGHRTGSTDVVTERWTWLLDDRAVVLAGTVARADYPDYCELFEEVAATVEISGDAPGPALLAGARW